MNFEYYQDQIKKMGHIDENWYVVGIDLGTTNTVACYWNSKLNRPEPVDVSNGFGKIPMPSVVQLRQEEGYEDEWVIGEEALHTTKLYPNETISSIKRHMGTNHQVVLGGQAYLPEEISGMILKQLLAHVQNLNPKMELAGLVVSVPYDFDDAAKKATIKACALAGVSDQLICLIEEPKAAALAYNFRHDLYEDEKVMVFDFGGGTLDITIFHVAKKDEEAIYLKVISEGGEAYHGGDNIDDILYKKLKGIFELKNPNQAFTKEIEVELMAKARETKERLSGVAKHRIPFTFCVPPFAHTMSREDFLKDAEGFIQKTKQLCLEALKEGYNGPIKAQDISRVLLEGGSSKMPWVRDMFREIFEDRDILYVSEHPALDIAMGATYYAGMKMGLLTHRELETSDVSVNFEVPVPHDIGFEVVLNKEKSFYAMITRGTPYPLAKKSMTFTLKGETQAEMTSLDLVILERIKKGDDLNKCRLIGQVKVEGLPERPSGMTRLQVTLTIDEIGGIVKGEVKDVGYGTMYQASGFKKEFSPVRYESNTINVNEA